MNQLTDDTGIYPMKSKRETAEVSPCGCVLLFMGLVFLMGAIVGILLHYYYPRLFGG